MLEILEGKGLSFLFPLMKLEKELLKQIKVDTSPQSIYKWIKENVSARLHTDKGFVNILMTRYASKELNFFFFFFNNFALHISLKRSLFSVSCSSFCTRSTPMATKSSWQRPPKSSWTRRNNFCCLWSRWCRSSCTTTLTCKWRRCTRCRSTATPRVSLKVCAPPGSVQQVFSLIKCWFNCCWRSTLPPVLQECCCDSLFTFTTWK